jgi:hypothetical protein
VLAVLMMMVVLAGCTSAVPVTPYPEPAYVPHPLHVPPGSSYEALMELYSTSPNRNPDGLGVLDTVWLNSRLTLLTWETARAREASDRIAYARDDAEQRRVLAEQQALFDRSWIFEGILLGDLPKALQVAFYLPEGIYLMDDRGRKFLPLSAKDLESAAPLVAASRFGQGHFSYPSLVFQKEAIDEATRAVSVYFAALQKRLRFTWIFDPDYSLPAGGADLEGGQGRNRLFPPRG